MTAQFLSKIRPCCGLGRGKASGSRAMWSGCRCRAAGMRVPEADQRLSASARAVASGYLNAGSGWVALRQTAASPGSGTTIRSRIHGSGRDAGEKFPQNHPDGIDIGLRVFESCCHR